MNKILMPLMMSGALMAGGCSHMSTTEQRALSGTAIGALGGLAVGAAVGRPTTGLGLGAAAGALGGVIYDQYDKDQHHR